MLATASEDASAKVWSVESGKAFFGLSGHRNNVNAVAWSANGERLATGSDDWTTKVWDARTGRQLLTLAGHQGKVLSVAWSADGTRLAAAGADHGHWLLQVYAMDIKTLMALARKRVTRNLSPEECRKYLHLDEVPPIPFG